MHGLDQTQLMPRRPVAGVQHIAARVGAAQKQLTLPVSGLGPGHAGSASLVALIMEKHCAARHLFLIMRQRRGFYRNLSEGLSFSTLFL